MKGLNSIYMNFLAYCMKRLNYLHTVCHLPINYLAYCMKRFLCHLQVLLCGLQKHKHQLEKTAVGGDNVQSIEIIDDDIFAFTDSRKESYPAGI